MLILCPHCRSPIELVQADLREEIVCPSCASSFWLESGSTTGFQQGSEPTAEPECGVGKKLGRFELLGVVGQGAFGSVYRARDPELDRAVAVKVPRTGNLAGEQELARFMREARSAAQLRHPSIVTVHEVGQIDGVPYLVSDFVFGRTLTAVLSAGRLSFRDGAAVVASAADALHYAHEQGVVHRDVKPSNIMIDDTGRPLVMDFGLARRDAGEATMTVEGQILGTPAYMPPEQARGEGHRVDARGDVYSLGVVLYQLLTGELPFRGATRMLLHQLLHDEPRPPRSLNDRIPRDLETITLKAMAKEPARRYATAKALADDLRWWLNGEPIAARPVGRLEQATRWARRRPAAAGLLAVSFFAVMSLTGLVVGLAYNAELKTAYDAEASARAEADSARKTEEEQRKAADQARSREEVQRKKAEGALALADRLGYVHSVWLAEQALKENNLALARQRLRECKEELREWEWHYLNAQCETELFTISGYHPHFNADGGRIAAVGADGTVRLYDGWTGQVLRSVKSAKPTKHFGYLYQFSPDGTVLLVQLGDGNVRLYDAARGDEMITLAAAKGFRMAQFTSNRNRILAWCTDDKSRVYDGQTGQELFTLQASIPIVAPRISLDGTRIAGQGPEGKVGVYDGNTGKELFVLKGPTGHSDFESLSADGRRIVTSSSRRIL